MAWTGLVLTVEGRNALNQAQLSNRINFKSIVVGDGKAPANFGTRRELVHQLYEITAIKVDAADGGCTITADFPEVSYDYYFREIGLIAAADAGDILYVYDNCGDDAQYIVSSTGAEKTKKRIRLSLAISDVDKITVSEPQILYVSYDDYEASINRLDAEIEDKETELKEEIDRESRRAAEAEEQLKKDMVSEVSALNEAVGRKANAAEFDSHVKDTVKHVTAAERESWNNKLPAAGGDVSGSLDVAGVVNSGGKARMWTDNEGGNFGLTAPDGTQWRIDAVNGNLRIFTYANGGHSGIVINKMGQVSFPDGAHGTWNGPVYGRLVCTGGVGRRGIHADANGFGIDLPPEEGYAGGLEWYQGNTAVGCLGYYKQGGYYYFGTDYAAPNGTLRAGSIYANDNVFIKFPYALYVRHIEGADGQNLFLNYNHPGSSVVIGDVDNRYGGIGFLYAGVRAAIWTDTEGGNVRIISPNDVEYQMDAFNDNLRLYRHVGDDYRSAFTVDGTGRLNCPYGVMTNNIQGPNSGANGFVLINPSYAHDDYKIRIGACDIGGNMWITTVCSEKDNEYDLGTLSKRWSQVYAVNSAISTSDETMKRNITPLDRNMTKAFVMGLNPISYIRTDGESGRTHYGMGAQSVERLMEELGMTSMDFAGLIKSPMYEDYEVEEEVEVEKLVPNENGKPIPRKVREIQKVTKQREVPGRYRYGLRYEEFIAPLIKMVQMQQKEIEELKRENNSMERRLEKIERMIGN